MIDATWPWRWLAMSRQRRYQLRHRAAGLCLQCSRVRVPTSKMYCRPHLEGERLRMRAVRQGQPWRPRGRGRPPLEHRQRTP